MVETTFHPVDVARFEEVVIDIGGLGSFWDFHADAAADARSQAEGRFMA